MIGNHRPLSASRPPWPSPFPASQVLKPRKAYHQQSGSQLSSGRGCRERSKACRVFLRSMATVMGPTPPGTGVMAEATGATESKSTSPTSFPSTRLIPTSITTAPGLTISPVIRRGATNCRDQDVGATRLGGEVRGAGVADGDRGMAMEQEEGDRLPDDLAPPHHDRVSSCDLDLLPIQKLQDTRRRAGDELRLGSPRAGRCS